MAPNMTCLPGTAQLQQAFVLSSTRICSSVLQYGTAVALLVLKTPVPSAAAFCASMRLTLHALIACMAIGMLAGAQHLLGCHALVVLVPASVGSYMAVEELLLLAAACKFRGAAVAAHLAHWLYMSLNKPRFSSAPRASLPSGCILVFVCWDQTEGADQGPRPHHNVGSLPPLGGPQHFHQQMD